MKEITNRELLQLQLDILRDVDSFCRSNGIEYFLVGGTGIGAVRHGGYIPWDDDIDIGMTRPNYDRFLSSFNGHYTNLVVYAPELNWNYYAPYANVCDSRTILFEQTNSHNGIDIGVKIDIFPYDPVPSNQQTFESMRRKAKLLNALCYYKRHSLKSTSIISFRELAYTVFCKVFLLPRRYSSLQKALHRLTTSISWNEAECLEKIVFPYSHNKPCRRELFESYCDIPFENLVLRNLKDHDTYLKSVFGDYMQLPPESQRIMNHGFKAFWKD